MTTTRKRPGRPPLTDGGRGGNINAYISETTKTQWEEYAARRGLSLSSATVEAIEWRLAADEAERNTIPVLGYIYAGDAAEVRHASDSLFVTPREGSPKVDYALLVVGDSMTTSIGRSIPDGSVAMFEQRDDAPEGAICHVEFPRADGEHDCTLKKYYPPIGDNGEATFVPLNEKHEPFTRKRGEYEIRGVYVTYQDGAASN